MKAAFKVCACACACACTAHIIISPTPPYMLNDDVGWVIC